VDEELIRRGLAAWTDGDLDALEAVLDPQVTLRGIDPGPWDCTGRDQVMRLLRQRRTERQPPFPVRIERVDEHTIIVSSRHPAEPAEPGYVSVATRVQVAGGKVVAMQQYRDDDRSTIPAEQ
jgi:ketosteroid isomerase-like protein